MPNVVSTMRRARLILNKSRLQRTEHGSQWLPVVVNALLLLQVPHGKRLHERGGQRKRTVADELVVEHFVGTGQLGGRRQAHLTSSHALGEVAAVEYSCVALVAVRPNVEVYMTRLRASAIATSTMEKYCL